MTFLSSGNFHEKIIPDSENSNLQQYLVIAMWLAIAGVSYFRATVLRIAPTAGFYLSLAPYALAVVSTSWSENPAASMSKGAALVIVTFSAYRLVRTMAMDDIVECVIHGLFLLNALSIVLSLFVPDIGILTDWQHAGQWNGIFGSKQTLGICGALLLFFSSYRLIDPPRKPYHYLAAASAFACVVGSGSRGGGALAAVAVSCIYLTGVSARFAKILAFGPFALGLIASALIVYFLQTGNKYLYVFGTEVDFTERTFIWQHALSYFKSAPLLGYGLNGFWTLKGVEDTFRAQYGWFLDNYHDGYIGVLMETGVIGLSIFISGYLIYGFRILTRIREAGSLNRDVGLTLVYTCLICFIDLTETFFLRSTNIVSTMLVMSIFICFARRSRLVIPNPAPSKRLPRSPAASRART
ncbi:MAG: O-antigen ligase family protein [Methylocystis sp.]